MSGESFDKTGSYVLYHILCIHLCFCNDQLFSLTSTKVRVEWENLDVAKSYRIYNDIKKLACSFHILTFIPSPASHNIIVI